MGLIYYLTHKLDQALDANSQKITNLADGTDPGDAVNKGQLDAGGGGSDVATQTHAASSKATPVDADEFPITDSAASFALKKLTWANLKATAKAYFDTLYDATGAAAAAQAASQPLDSDLTAIAALSTTSFGRALLALADAAALRTDAGLVIGTDVEAHDADLTTIAGLSPTNDDILQRKSGAWTNRTAAQLISDLAALGTTFQPLDSDLTAIAALSTTAYGRSLLIAADAAAARTTLGLGTLATQSGTFSGTSSGTNTGDQTTVSGNAGTATALQTARAIDGQAFDGTADVTVIAPGTHAATSKATPVDADELSLVDSAASNVLKKLTWANAKATLKAYFDTLYTAVGASAPPNGSAGGDLGGTYPNPTVAALHETAGPTKLTLGSVPDGDYLVRSGSTIVGGSPTPGGPPTGAAGGALAGTYPNPSLAGKTIDGQTFDGNSNITVIAPGTHGATGKTTPVDADELALVDSAASNVLKKLTWANLKATLKTYFDTLYQASGASAGGDLTGTYPNPTIAAGKVVLADLAAAVRPGMSQLVYRYIVTGSDKASIDTGVDTPDAGSNDWTNGDLLEIFLYMRTDEAAILSAVNLTLNNDGGAVYDRVVIQVSNTTVTGAKTLGGTAFALNAAGASAAAGVFSPYKITFPAYTRTVGNKSGTLEGGVPDNSTSILLQNQTYDYRPASPAALTRLAIAPGTAGKKLKVGTQLLIYKRLAS